MLVRRPLGAAGAPSAGISVESRNTGSETEIFRRMSCILVGIFGRVGTIQKLSRYYDEASILSLSKFPTFSPLLFSRFFLFVSENVQLLILQISGPLCRYLRLHIFYLTILHCFHLIWSSSESIMRHVVDDTARKENNTVWLHNFHNTILTGASDPFSVLSFRKIEKVSIEIHPHQCYWSQYVGPTKSVFCLFLITIY